MKLKPVIIGFAGKPQVGKDTAAAYIMKKYGGKRVSTGDVVKQEFDKMLKCIGLSYDESKKQEFRGGLTWLGSYRRQLEPDYWVDIISKQIVPPAIIPDIRYPNEVKMVESKEGAVFKIIRERDPSQDNMPTEIALDDHDFKEVIDNNGTFEEMYEQIDKLLVKYNLLTE